MGIAENYLDGLKKKYEECGGAEEWSAFENVAHGAGAEDLARLRGKFPDVPDSLIRLLEHIDGTYWREYAGEKRCLYFLGSELEEYPYYLLSAAQMSEISSVPGWLCEFVDRDFGDEGIDDRIIDDSSKAKWLHFSDCMNNGGTSQLFIDFSPSPTGKKGQIVMYVHDPDELTVIADSFDEYLKNLIDGGFDFIFEDLFT